MEALAVALVVGLVIVLCVLAIAVIVATQNAKRLWRRQAATGTMGGCSLAFYGFSGNYVQVGEGDCVRTTTSPRFIFVDNTSATSFGTIENPYASLADAESNSAVGDVIYVLLGDGTSSNLNHGIVLKAGQQLFGAGVAHTVTTNLGSVAIPVIGTGRPILTSTTSGAVVSLADNNVVEGLQLELGSAAAAVAGTGIADFRSAYNTYFGGTGTSLPLPAGIALWNVSGSITVDHDSYDNVGSPYGSGVNVTCTGSTSVAVSYSTFTSNVAENKEQGSAVLVADGDVGDTLVNISNITVNGFWGGVGVFHGNWNGGGHNTMTVNISDSIIRGAQQPGATVINVSDYGALNMSVANTSVLNNGTYGLYLQNSGAYVAPFTFTATNSVFSNNALVPGGSAVDSPAGISFLNNSNGPCTITVSNCQANGNGCSVGGRVLEAAGLAVASYYDSVTVSVSNSQFNGNGNCSNGGLVNDASGVVIFSQTPATGAGAMSLNMAACTVADNGLANGGTVTGFTAGLAVENVSDAPMTVTGLNGTLFGNNNQYGILAFCTVTGSATVDYNGATFTGTAQTPTNQDTPGNTVTWIS